MPNPPSLLNQQSDQIKGKIERMARTQHYAVIVKWLNSIEIGANYNQVRHYLATHNCQTRLQEIKPVVGYDAKLHIYIGALLDYPASTFTIHNLRLRGPSWSEVTKRLHVEGLIAPLREYAPVRWQIRATKDELKTWMKKEEHICME